jgi:hypothetical protein
MKKTIHSLNKVGLCALIFVIYLSVSTFIIRPLSQPLIFISNSSEVLTNETGIQHYQQSVPIGSIWLSIIMWIIPLMLQIVLTPRLLK